MEVNMSSKCALRIYYVLGALIGFSLAFPDQGKWQGTLNERNSYIIVPKSLFRESQIFIQVQCSIVDTKNPNNPNKDITITWTLLETRCWQDFLRSDTENLNNTQHISKTQNETCNSNIIMEEFKHELKSTTSLLAPPSDVKREEKKETSSTERNVKNNMNRVHFYGAMCLVYVIFGLAWLIVSFCQWRDLLRIQFWIGGVILLGMLEKATFYAEYQSINSTGESVKGAMLLAELVSCGKRTLARMLVIIVSLGFGIVKNLVKLSLYRHFTNTLIFAVISSVIFMLYSIKYHRLASCLTEDDLKWVEENIPASLADT
ncbi:Transmembrane protein 87B [Blattella germanica]|nr:Transmembrane protein 87B [Blattella germanica]